MRHGLMMMAGAAMLLWFAGPVAAQEWPSATQTTALLQDIAARLDDFDLHGEVRTYTRENLRQYIKQEAERYFAYDYQWTVVGMFRDTRSEALITVDVFRFRDTMDAFGAATIDRDPAAPGEFVPLPGQRSPIAAHFSGNRLHVWRGPLYVRIVPGAPGDGLKVAAMELGQAVTEGLPAVEREPAVFRLLPTRGLIVESLKFQRRDVLGQGLFESALLATYGRRLPDRKLDVDMHMLLFDGQDPAGAQAVFSSLEGHLAGDGDVRPVAALGEAAFIVRHATHGPTHVMRQGRYVVMLRQVKRADAAEALLREIGKNIRLAR